MCTGGIDNQGDVGNAARNSPSGGTGHPRFDISQAAIKFVEGGYATLLLTVVIIPFLYYINSRIDTLDSNVEHRVSTAKGALEVQIRTVNTETQQQIRDLSSDIEAQIRDASDSIRGRINALFTPRPPELTSDPSNAPPR